MKAVGLRCFLCTQEYPLDILRYECARCRGRLEISYRAEREDPKRLRRLFRRARVMWDFGELLPVDDLGRVVTLHEGGTPLIGPIRPFQHIGLESVFLKNEAMNPTGSFKDRPISVITTKAKEAGAEVIATASSGNAGVAVAAYAAAAGMPAVIFLPHGTSTHRLAIMRLHGAKPVLVEGTYSDAYRLCATVASQFRWVNATTTFLNPYGIEGDKTVAYEIVADLGFKPPDWVIVPVGAGPLLVGCYKGFRELQAWGMMRRVPSMIAVQASGCAPIAEAFRQGKERVEAWKEPSTVASGVADPLVGYEQDGTLTLKAVQESHGLVLAVDDEEILGATGWLAEKIGLLTEPTGALSVAALIRLAKSGFFPKRARIVCILTGSGYKEVQLVETRTEISNIPLIQVDPCEALKICREYVRS